MSNGCHLKFLVVSSLISASVAAHADSIQLDTEISNHYSGAFQTVIQLNPQSVSKFYAQAKPVTQEALTNTKVITLMRLNPSAALAAKAEQVASAVEAGYALEPDYSKGILSFSKSNSAKDLAMNDVPVLDQGEHGTCVTFATTAALDAVLNKGDFIDQQCTLSLNLSLGKDYWDGANYASQVLLPLQKHGVVEKNNCPASYPAPKYKITPTQYAKFVDQSVDLNTVSYKYHSEMSVGTVRNAINEGHRVAMGFMLKATMDPITVQGFDVTVDGQKRKGGLWACKQPGSTANYCGFAYAGHEVVITGYDDAQHLFKIRNSWSDAAADEGDFYMTYEFFTAMVIDGTEIW